MSDYIGQQFGNYRLLRLLGQGGFADVYLGEHIHLRMQAAVKILYAHLVDKEIEAFESEAQTLANLVHPQIIRLLDFDVQQGTPFLVLDYAPNGSLREKYPRGHSVALEVVVSHIRQVGSALQFAHDHRLIHRDIKPANMLVGKQGEILLSDFGIASVAHSTSSRSTQASIGTAPFMAPEQIQGKPQPASDQYALAVTIYLWLSGAFPFQGSLSEVIAQHLAVEPPLLRSKAPHISIAVEEVVMTALAKDPKRRFDSVQEFAMAFTQASEHDLARRNNRHEDAPVAPALPVLPSPQPAADTLPAPPLHTPVLEQIARIPNRESISLPSRSPASMASARQKTDLWRIWLIGTMIIVLLGSIAAMAVYNPQSTNNNGSFTSNNTDTNIFAPQISTSTPTPAISLTQPYIADAPGPTCDTGGATWTQSFGSITCLGNASRLDPDPNQSYSEIEFYWAQAFPNDFTTSVDISELTPNQGCLDFAIDPNTPDNRFASFNFSDIRVCPPDIDVGCCTAGQSIYHGSSNATTLTVKIAHDGSSMKFFLNSHLLVTSTIDPSVVFWGVQIHAALTPYEVHNFVFTPLTS